MQAAAAPEPSAQDQEGPGAQVISASQARAQRRKRLNGRRLFNFDRSLETRFVAGADEAGRGCRPGTHVAEGARFA